MKFISDLANKKIKSLNEEINKLFEKERETATYNIGVDEVNPYIPPAYDFVGLNEQIDKKLGMLYKLKHAINEFNNRTVLPALGITIDMALVEMSIINKRLVRLNSLLNLQEKVRESAGGFHSNPEYKVRNFNEDVRNKIQEMYEQMGDRLLLIQAELNKANVLEEFEVSFDD